MRGTYPCAQAQVSVESLESRRLLSVAVPNLAAVSTAVPPATTVTPIPTPVSVNGTGLTFQAQATEPFSETVGKIAGPVGTTGLSATIDWGDGTPPSQGTFVYLPSPTATTTVLGIDGQHTYASAGTYAVNSIVTRQVGPPGSLGPIILVSKIQSTAIVSPDTEGGVTLLEPAFHPFTATLGTFDYIPVPVASSNPVNPVISATIDWGDGSVSRGIIEKTGDDDYAVIGSHEYSAVGDYSVHVIVTATLIPPPVPVLNSTGSTAVPTSGATPPIYVIADFYSTIEALPTPTPVV